MKHCLLICLLLTTYNLFSSETDNKPAEEEKTFSLRITGFVKSDYWLDSRSVVAAREDLFLLYPANVLTDTDGKDINSDPVFNFSAITSRIAAVIEGPDAFGATVTGLIEADFSGVTNTDINGFRLRHAYMKLQWERLGLLLGQWWHPMFGIEVIPTVVSLNTGAPFQPFIRNPQATMTYNTGNSRWLFSMIAQRDNASDGPRGASPDYIRDALLPNVHLQYTRTNGNVTTGLAADYKVIRPRRFVIDDIYQIQYTSETLNTFAFMAYARYRYQKFDIKGKAIYGQNMSEHLMLGGYAESQVDPKCGAVTYTPLNNMSLWGNILYGDRIVAGFFAGYAKNFGASDEVMGNYFGRGENIAYLYRVAPSVTFNSGSIALCTELEYTAAAYGIPDARGRVKNHSEVGNLRLLFTALYFF
jgi:hypothetical protein